jgi:hypothetical protein
MAGTRRAPGAYGRRNIRRLRSWVEWLVLGLGGLNNADFSVLQCAQAQPPFADSRGMSKAPASPRLPCRAYPRKGTHSFGSNLGPIRSKQGLKPAIINRLSA